ncbi:hypothetical protein SLA2020_068310 [Shorea laevis]
MADQQEEEDFRMALGMSMQNAQPEPKRSKPGEVAASGVTVMTTPDEARLLQRELMAAAAEKRMQAAKALQASGSSPSEIEKSGDFLGKDMETTAREGDSDILAQWSNQGIRFSPDPETSMRLVQHEGGPCGVLATIQAFVLKYLLFFPDELGKTAPEMLQNSGVGRFSQNQYVASENFGALTEDVKASFS